MNLRLNWLHSQRSIPLQRHSKLNCQIFSFGLSFIFRDAVTIGRCAPSHHPPPPHPAAHRCRRTNLYQFIYLLLPCPSCDQLHCLQGSRSGFRAGMTLRWASSKFCFVSLNAIIRTKEINLQPPYHALAVWNGIHISEERRWQLAGLLLFWPSIAFHPAPWGINPH